MEAFTAVAFGMLLFGFACGYLVGYAKGDKAGRNVEAIWQRKVRKEALENAATLAAEASAKRWEEGYDDGRAVAMMQKDCGA